MDGGAVSLPDEAVGVIGERNDVDAPKYVGAATEKGNRYGDCQHLDFHALPLARDANGGKS